MRANEIRELSDQELDQRLDESYKEILNLRFRLATRQLTNTSEIRVVKKNIARLNTIRQERKLGVA